MEENKKLRPKRRRLPTRTKFDPTSHRPVSPSVVPGMDVWTSPSTPNALEEHDQDPSPVTVGTPNRDPSMTPRTMQRHRQRLANITERLKSLAAEKDDNDSGLDLSSHIVLPRNLEELFKGNGRTYRTIKESVSVREYGAPVVQKGIGTMNDVLLELRTRQDRRASCDCGPSITGEAKNPNTLIRQDSTNFARSQGKERS